MKRLYAGQQHMYIHVRFYFVHVLFSSSFYSMHHSTETIFFFRWPAFIHRRLLLVDVRFQGRRFYDEYVCIYIYISVYMYEGDLHCYTILI